MGEKKGPRQFSREFKLRAVERMQAGESPSALQRELGVKRKSLYEWKKRVEDGGPQNLRDGGRPGPMPGSVIVDRAKSDQRRIAELERLVNHKRVLRLLRADNLLALRKKRFISTTDGRHGWRMWPNLARWHKPEGPNRQWVADITYLRLRGEFCYLAVALDVWSRRVVGWALGSVSSDCVNRRVKSASRNDVGAWS
jgi:transposase-like protein